MDLKKLIKLQNAIIRAHQKIKDVQSDNNLQTKEIKDEFKKEFNGLNKALEQLNEELSSFTKKEDLNKHNEELERLKNTLNEVNKSIDDKISKIQLKHGIDGKNGKDGINGKDGKDGINGRDGKDGKDGANGLSAYEIAVKQGYEGTEEEWIEHITNNGGKDYSGQIAAMNQRVNKVSRTIKTDGKGDKYLSDDGTYKEVSGSGEIPEDVLTQSSILRTIEECEQCTGESVPAANLLAMTYNSIPKTVSELENDSGLVEKEDLKKSKFIIREYATYDDLPKPIISYSYSTSFDYLWGPPSDYYYYVNGEWITDVEGVYLSIENPQYSYTPEDLANVTCKITSELPTDLYPDITEDSFSLSMGYSEISPSYISVNYYPVLTTSYGDYEHNPWILGLNLSLDIILPPKPNSEVVEDVIYKVLDTNKCYILDTETYEWVEFDESVLNLIPVMHFIDNIKQDKLVSGKNIATINNQSLLNGGDLSLATSTNLNSYLLKTYVRNSRNTSSSGYTYDVRYINNMVKTSRTTSSYNTYDCTYINGLIKTSKQSSNNYTYSCNYIDNNFLTLDTLPRWDGGNQ